MAKLHRLVLWFSGMRFDLGESFWTYCFGNVRLTKPVICPEKNHFKRSCSDDSDQLTKNNAEAVDLICGGFQPRLSIAGKRAACWRAVWTMHEFARIIGNLVHMGYCWKCPVFIQQRRRDFAVYSSTKWSNSGMAWRGGAWRSILRSGHDADVCSWSEVFETTCRRSIIEREARLGYSPSRERERCCLYI